MRIGIDARQVQDHFPGIGRYAYNLVRGLLSVDSDDTFVVFYHPGAPNIRYSWGDLDAGNLELAPVPVPVFSPLEQTLFPWLIRRRRLDLFHSPYYVRPYVVPCPSVVTIHDTIPSRHPDYLPSRRSRFLYRLTMRLAIRSSKLIIADSHASEEDLVRFFGVPPERIRVIPLAADEFFAPSDDVALGTSAPSPYVLFVGVNKPHKNMVRLIEAYARSGVAQHLLIAGAEDERFPEPRQTARRLDVEEKVRFLGRVDEVELARLYRFADAFVFPSLAEGFGLPLLEAMASGVPVLSSNIPCLAEVAGDAALLVDPYDVAAMAGAIRRVSEDAELREALCARGRERVRLFSWPKTAAQTLEVYREVAGP